MDVLIINGHDYSRFVERKGLAWSRNDLDSDKTTRTKDGKMRRDKVCTKRKNSYTLINMTQPELAKVIGIAVNTIGNIERGDHPGYIDKIIMLCYYINTISCNTQRAKSLIILKLQIKSKVI